VVAEKTKSRLLIHIEYFLILIPIVVVRALPLKVAYGLSYILSIMFYYIDFRHKERAMQHILHSGIVSDRKAAAALARRNFLHFGRVAVEIAKSHQIVNEKNALEFIKQETGPELTKVCFAPETRGPVIIVTCHLGNWELAGKAYSWLSGMRMTSIMRELGNPKLGDIIYAHREGLGHSTVSKNKGMKPLMMALKRGESVAIVADQHASTSEGVGVEFFGHPARAHSTPALLHLKTDVPIIVGALLKTGNSFQFAFRGDEVIRYTPTGDKDNDIKAITQTYTSALEALIRKYPDQWMWAHRRWLNINRNRKNKKKEISHEQKSANPA